MFAKAEEKKQNDARKQKKQGPAQGNKATKQVKLTEMKPVNQPEEQPKEIVIEVKKQNLLTDESQKTTPTITTIEQSPEQDKKNGDTTNKLDEKGNI